MKVGFSQKDITPSFPYPLCGYEWKRIAHTSHDPIYVKVVVFVDVQPTVFISLDWIAIDHCLFDCICESLKELNIKREHIIVSATHTHSGPAGVVNTKDGLLKEIAGIFGDTNETYIERTIQDIRDCVEVALSNLDACTIQVKTNTIDGVGSNRNTEGECDNKLLVLEVLREDGKQLLLYNYACHPTVMSKDNVVMSADFPGAVTNELTEYDMVYFINGSAGDISTRFTRKEASFKQVELYGKMIAKRIREATTVYEGEMDAISIKTKQIPLSVKVVDRVEVAEAKLLQLNKQLEALAKTNATKQELRIASAYCEGARTNVNLAKSLSSIQEIVIYTNVIQFNGFTCITIPGEIFSTLTKPLRNIPNTYIFGYTNGYCLYIADQDAYEQGYYEALSSPFAKGEGERLIYEVERCIK